MVGEGEEEESPSSPGIDEYDCDLMSRVETISEVLQQTTHNLALFERLLPAARRDSSQLPPGG